MAPPEISVVITVFNEEKNIKPLLDATFDALKELPYEVIIVDDGSTDSTVEEVRRAANASTTLLVFNRALLKT